jgi:anaerobic ribonucleoside-triphosphate reductase activating protein
MEIRLASSIQKVSVVDGVGIRSVIWTQGCSHNCPFCHNPSTHDFNKGKLFDIEDIKKEISNLKGQTGITFSGGDPLYQIDAVIELSKYIHSLNMDIWCYTGFTYEEVLKMKRGKELLSNIDVLVDGLFMIEKRSLDLPFRGSSNQRIIKAKESIKANKIILDDNLMKPKDIKPLYKKDKDIYI